MNKTTLVSLSMTSVKRRISRASTAQKIQTLVYNISYYYSNILDIIFCCKLSDKTINPDILKVDLAITVNLRIITQGLNQMNRCSQLSQRMSHHC